MRQVHCPGRRDREVPVAEEGQEVGLMLQEYDWSERDQKAVEMERYARYVAAKQWLKENV